MLTRKALAIAAAASLVFAPVAAQAGTRAAVSPVTVPVQMQGASGDLDDAAALIETHRRFSAVWLLAGLALVAVIVAAASNTRSRG